MSPKRICAAIYWNLPLLRTFTLRETPGTLRSSRAPDTESAILSLGIILLLGACTHVSTKVSSKGGFTTVVLDASHGGKDNGGTSWRGSNPFQLEKNLTLDTAKRIRDLLRRSGFRVVMMRDGDYFIELDDRVARATGKETKRFWSAFHYNATGNSSANGAELYYWRADSHGLATGSNPTLHALPVSNMEVLSGAG